MTFNIFDSTLQTNDSKWLDIFVTRIDQVMIDWFIAAMSNPRP